MHFITSLSFVPSIMRNLTPSSQNLLLHCWFSFLVAYWVKRGRPPLPVTAFYDHTSMLDECPSQTSSIEGSFACGSCAGHRCWSSILHDALEEPDVHYVKCQRSLAQFAERYGNTSPGRFPKGPFRGAEILDGSIFGRVALLNAARLKSAKGARRSVWERKCVLFQEES